MKKYFLLSGLITFSIFRVAAQPITGFLKEDFENSQFPPAGWQVVSESGDHQWSRSTDQHLSGTASAFIQYQSSTPGKDWLIMPAFRSEAGSDSLVFWMQLAFTGYQPDSLCIKISTTDSLITSFTKTLLKLNEGTNYPSNSTTWYRYAISLSAYTGKKIFIAFKHYDTDGDGLYIDDVTIGTKPVSEVMAGAILNEHTVMGPVIPRATIINNGSAIQSFDVGMKIFPGGYLQVVAVNDLAPSAATTVSFPAWTPDSAGVYTFKAFTRLASDEDRTNDTITKSIQVIKEFSNQGWSAHTPLPSGRWATAPVFSKACIASTDTGYIFLISGGDESFANANTNYRLDLVNNTWSARANIPVSRTQITPVQAGNRIFVFGGYGGSFSPVNTTSIYDIQSNSWTTGAPVPAGTGDYAIGVYRDTLIYIVGGYSGSADLNAVQIYHVNTDRWSAGTNKPGVAVAGGRMGITGNVLVFAGGYSQSLSSSLANAYVGVIDSTDFTQISWKPVPDYPDGPSGRLAGGVSFQQNGHVYFAGGDPNGMGNNVINKVYAFNTKYDKWEQGPAMLNGVSNISGLAGIIQDDKQWLVTMGGYNGTAVVKSDEWLEIGPVNPLPSVQSDTSICKGLSIPLHACHGISYHWSPADGLSNTHTAEVLAAPVESTVYSVTMEKGYGCPAIEQITVLVNELPDASAGCDIEICAGTDTLLAATGGDAFSWSPPTGLSNVNINNPVANPAETTRYKVIVTNALTGCSDTAHLVVKVNELPKISLTATDVTCNGSGDGKAKVEVEDASTYSFVWSSGDLTAEAVDLEPGNYIITVMDNATGCEAADTVDVNEPAPLQVTLTETTIPGSAGSLHAEVTGGIPEYTYLWNDAFCQTTASATGLGSGIYRVVVTDSKDCEISKETSILLSTGFKSPDSSVTLEVYPNPCVDQIRVKTEIRGTNSRIDLVNMLGTQIMLTEKIENQGTYSRVIDMTAFPAGIYYLQVIRGNEVVSSEKIVKK